MKQPVHYIAFFFLLLLSCKGSDTYQGTWKVTDAKGEHLTFHFQPKQLIVEKEGLLDSIDYKQNSIRWENGKSTYGIQLDNGLSYNISFPISKQKDKAIILTEEEIPIYVISRTEYIDYDEFYKF